MHILGLILTSFVSAFRIGGVKELVLQKFCESQLFHVPVLEHR